MRLASDRNSSRSANDPTGRDFQEQIGMATKNMNTNRSMDIDESELKMARIRERLGRNFFGKFGMLGVLICIFVACSIVSPFFLQVKNLLNITRQVSVMGILSLGQTLIIITGGIDLSVGSMLAISTLFVAGFTGLGPVASVLLALAIATLCGALNGLIITKGKVQPFIATLGMMTIIVGVGLTYSGGHPIIGINNDLHFIGQGTLGLVPIAAVLFAVAAAACAVLLTYTRIGRYIFAIGGNQEGSRLAGIHVNKVKTIVYMLSGFFSGFAGIIMASHLNIGEANIGKGFELDSIAAVVVGGTSLSGGQGSIGKTIIGVLIIGMINNFLNLMNIPGYSQQIVKGAIIIGAVLIQSFDSSAKR
ncbi:MAG: ABC transporter permease [Rectinemataceae bacterium]|jgi:ribose/xylose/arabinose/galactoside ABC-type transport system permease subunit